MVERVGNAGANVVEEIGGFLQDIPGVPSEKSSQVDAKTACKQEDADDDRDKVFGEDALEYIFQVQETQIAKQQANPGKTEHHDEVIPDRGHVWPGEVEKVGEDVGGIGEEDQPCANEGDERERVSGQFGVQDGNTGECPGDEGKEEVPVEEAVFVGAGEFLTCEKECEADEGGDAQKEGFAVAVGGAESVEHGSLLGGGGIG